MLDLRDFFRNQSIPGIDSRTWVSYGKILSSSPSTQDVFDMRTYYASSSGGAKLRAIEVHENSIYAAIILVPELKPLICRMILPVNGNGYCLYFPPQEGDSVIVLVPGGDYNQGPCFMLAPNNAEMPLPSEVVSNPDQVYVRAPEGMPLNINTTNADINLNSGASGIARKEDPITISSIEDDAFFTWIKAVSSHVGVEEPSSITGKISGGSSSVKCGD